jgi:hypothetical protein
MAKQILIIGGPVDYFLDQAPINGGDVARVFGLVFVGLFLASLMGNENQFVNLAC